MLKKNRLVDWQKKYKGFSLIEMLLAIFIFTIMIMVIMATFSQAFFSSRKTIVVQRNMEDGRTALETMAKNMRMSKKLTAITNGIKMFNNSQGKCIAYVFNVNKLQSISYVFSGSLSDPICSDPDLNSAVDMIASNVSGSFSIIPSKSKDTAGKATILINVGKANSSEIQHIQTTVSFRDF